MLDGGGRGGVGGVGAGGRKKVEDVVLEAAEQKTMRRRQRKISRV